MSEQRAPDRYRAGQSGARRARSGIERTPEEWARMTREGIAKRRLWLASGKLKELQDGGYSLELGDETIKRFLGIS